MILLPLSANAHTDLKPLRYQSNHRWKESHKYQYTSSRTCTTTGNFSGYLIKRTPAAEACWLICQELVVSRCLNDQLNHVLWTCIPLVHGVSAQYHQVSHESANPATGFWSHAWHWVLALQMLEQNEILCDQVKVSSHGQQWSDSDTDDSSVGCIMHRSKHQVWTLIQRRFRLDPMNR